jgi:hypothetical protein
MEPLKVLGNYCYEMILGAELFQQLIENTAGTYLLKKELILNFKEYCINPVDLYDQEMRKYCFEYCRRLLYVRQPEDPELISQAG